jgi:DNA replication protein DnaC
MDASSKPVGQLLGGLAGRDTVATCPAHGEYQARAWSIGGKDRFSACPQCEAEKARQAAADADRQRQLDRALRDADEAAKALSVARVPKRFVGKTFETYAADTERQRLALSICRSYAEDFAEHRKVGTGLTLAGGTGTGKSHLAAAIIQHISPLRSALYATVSDVVRGVRDTWRRDSPMSTGQMIDSLRNLDLLVLDEIGVQSGTDNEHQVLYDVLDGRYRDCAPTILLTNLDHQAMQAAIGDRLFDRLRETSRWVQCNWESYRPKARSQS